MLTLRRLTKTYDERPNYDLRRLLTGVDRLIDHLLDFSETEAAFTLGAIQCLPLAVSERDSISKAIKEACSKIKVRIVCNALAIIHSLYYNSFLFNSTAYVWQKQILETLKTFFCKIPFSPLYGQNVVLYNK